MTYLVLCILYDFYYIFIFSSKQFNLFLKHKSNAIITILCDNEIKKYNYSSEIK
jgi:hypothetical protein